MNCYLIGYDLHEGEDYENLITAIKSLGSWCHYFDSTWFVRCEYTPVQIRDYLKPHTVSGDRLFVATLTGEAAWFGLSGEKSEQIKLRLNGDRVPST